MELSESLIENTLRGRVVLFLGSGALVGSKLSNGEEPPLGDGLAKLLADGFLGGKFSDRGLAGVAELAESENDLISVQDFIADLFKGITPADYHSIIPSLKWRALVTTNYDQLIETVYQNESNRVQSVVPFISNQDRVDEKLQQRDQIALVKLHGCVSRTHDAELPLILTADQYIRYRQGRRRLFNHFTDWAYECPVVFVGHAMNDRDLRACIQEVSYDLAIRPRYYFVRPEITAEESRYWESQKITALSGSFEDLLRALDKKIPQHARPLIGLVSETHPIEERFTRKVSVSDRALDLLQNSVTYVRMGMATEDGEASSFFRGFDLGWYPVVSKIDVRRELTDRFLRSVIARAETDRPTGVDLYAVLAEAGSGKSVFLRRVAWESAIDGGAFCLFVDSGGRLDFDALKELCLATGERAFIFWDRASENTRSMVELVRRARKANLRITIITAERKNRWNTDCTVLKDYITGEFILPYLSRLEIESLVHLLEENDCLGPHLTSLTFDKRVKEFEERAGRQLLVALHEATMGRSFEEILLDEYSQIEPEAARRLYLTVCVLHRMNVGVRAGLIARVHRIPFEDFHIKLFQPLQFVVSAKYSWATGDYLYSARHPEIAQVVFDRVLTNPTDRFDEYIRILAEMNLAYSTDLRAFRGMIRAKTLNDLFPSHENVRSIYDQAQAIGDDDAHLFQQMANYERVRVNGNLSRAEDLAARARSLDPRDRTIIHTSAEVVLAQARAAKTGLEKARYIAEAKSFLRTLESSAVDARYAQHTLMKINLEELSDTLEDTSSSDREIDLAIRDTESRLIQGLQNYPDDEFLLTAEAEFRLLLKQKRRAKAALEKAHEVNPTDPYIAGRLARTMVESRELEAAEAVLKRALDANRGDKTLNFRYATVLRELDPDDTSRLLYYYQRSFTEWDTNYEAQFWYARCAFESEDRKVRERGTAVFEHLRSVSLAHDVRVKQRDLISRNRRPTLFTGEVVRLEGDYGFVTRDRFGDQVFFHRNHVEEKDWPRLREGLNVTYQIGFSFAGPHAVISLSIHDYIEPDGCHNQ